MTPLSLYKADLQKADFFADPSQAMAVDHLQRLYMDLQKQEKAVIAPPPSLFSRLFKKDNKKKSNRPSFKGIYFYGGVGRGKTYLVDLFFHSLPTQRKQRLHFHHFMLRVHKELTELQGQSDPLEIIAKRFAAQTDILCFDEFFVDDITDAMILAGMLVALFDEGISLVATSNIQPSDLYKNGLQRARFLPVIDLLNENCEVINLDGGRDYRIGRLIETEIYHFPLDEAAVIQINNAFEHLADGDKVYAKPIQINNRKISTIAYSADTLSIEFLTLCDGPRGTSDYIELAILYRTIIISNIKQMNDMHNDQVRRFIAMVDEFYEHHVVLIISAEVDIMQLYIGEKLNFEFQRCISRLIEMQSTTYLMQAHHIKDKL